MSDKKHIDRLFQEKLKDFEATPNAAVWENICAKLNSKKDDKKVIPIWWKLAGVAAALLLLLTVGNLIFDKSEKDFNVVNKDNFKDGAKTDAEENISVVNIDVNQKKTVETKLQSSNNNTNNNTNNQKKTIPPTIQNPNNKFANINKSVSKENQTILKSDSNNFNSQKTSKANKLSADAQTNEASEIRKSSEQLSNNTDDKLIESTINQKNEKEVLAINNSENNDDIDKNFSEEIIRNTDEEQLVIKEENKKTPLTEEVIVSNENINEKESINRWQINPNLAPVYFNSFGKGSPIHQQLVSNEKTGSVNISYGVNVSYSINNKLSIKSGVNRVNLGYSTNDIIVYEGLGVSGPNADIFRNIKINNVIQALTFVSGSDLGYAQSPAIVPDESLALLNQEMTYYEIPLEVKYKLSDKKISFSLVGGFSTFLLNDNSVSYEINGKNTNLGEATNLNDISYSANIGFGLDYNISKNINLNVDPLFKYKINTFNNASGSFKPFLIGVYSGINIKF